MLRHYESTGPKLDRCAPLLRTMARRPQRRFNKDTTPAIFLKCNNTDSVALFSVLARRAPSCGQAEPRARQPQQPIPTTA